jgi:carbamoyltransferase
MKMSCSMTYILGINAYHGDSSACLVKDGVLVAAIEEERFRRVKHWADFPVEAIRYCLSIEGIKLSHVDHVAINRNPKANLFLKMFYTLAKRPDLRLIIQRIKNAKDWMSVEKALKKAFPNERFQSKVHHVEHHLAHMSSAFYVSSFEKGVVVSVDGFGDFASAAWGVGRASALYTKGKVYFPHSLGIFYQSMTQYLGFPHYGDEYKVMGLSAYGKPRYLDQMHEIVYLKEDGGFSLNLDFFRHHKENIAYEWLGGAPTFECLFSEKLVDLLGPMRKQNGEITQHHKDIARSVQAMYEEAFFHLLNNLYHSYRIESLALAGGCALNSVANGKIYENTPFTKVYIQAAAGDAGGAIGAAYSVWHRFLGKNYRFMMDHAFWGPQFSSDQIRRLLELKRTELQDQQCKTERLQDEDELCERTAVAIAEGKVIGWFHGRMEWGPRALGNRSILCDPRRADMKSILNLKIKRRESFRPFAPSVLRERVQEWFETDDDVPFMMQVYQIRKEKRHFIPAVTHVDGSGRLQTVHRETNPRYYKLIEAFERLSGVPILLNTSFNENEPVVCKPEEALDCFLRTRIDTLVLEDWVVMRTMV